MSKERQRTKQTWKEPSPFTPMPNYDAMATPHIKVRYSYSNLYNPTNYLDIYWF